MSELTTLHLFSKYINFLPCGKIDASGVVSKDCYEEWLRTRRQPPRNPPHAFRKAITGHCRGDKGLQPFAPEVEVAVLGVLRKKTVWPCFKGTNFNIGQRGYQTLGHWEKKRKRQDTAVAEGNGTDVWKNIYGYQPFPKKRAIEQTTQKFPLLIHPQYHTNLVPFNLINMDSYLKQSMLTQSMLSPIPIFSHTLLRQALLSKSFAAQIGSPAFNPSINLGEFQSLNDMPYKNSP